MFKKLVIIGVLVVFMFGMSYVVNVVEIIYCVKVGEIFYKIGVEYGVMVEQLKEVNYKFIDFINVNEILIIFNFISESDKELLVCFV